jgi:cytochrome c oxidase subunit III
MSSAQLGMLLLLTSLSVLFGASLVAYAVTRAQNDVWRAPGMPPLPATLWASTAAMLLVSAALEWALYKTRHNQLKRAARGLTWAWVFIVGFVLCQVENWLSMRARMPAHTTLYPFTFYFLTGLHAAHVLAGLVPLSLVTWRQRQGEYSSSRYDGFKFCVQYWHFLGVVWLILFAVLEFAS